MYSNNLLLVIELAAAAGLLLVVFVFLIISKVRRTAKISFIFFLILILMTAGIVYSIIKGTPGYMVFSVFLSLLLMTPYCILLASGHSEEKHTDQRASETAKQQDQLPVAAEISQEEIQLLDVNREFIVQASEAFSSKTGLDTLLKNINSKLIQLCHADGGAILLLDEFEDVISVRAFDGDFPPPYKLPRELPHKKTHIDANFRHAQFSLHDNLFGEIALSGKPELIKNAQTDSRIYKNEPENFLKNGSLVLVPLKLHDTVIGLSALSKSAEEEPFTAEEFSTAVTVSDFASSAISCVYSFQEVSEHTELNKEADIAARVQKSLLPSKIPVIPAASVGLFSILSENVCGDYYDIIFSRKDRISFIMADIAGKGMTSLMIMIMIRAMLRLIVNTTQPAGKILSWANHGISEETAIDHFASLSLINYNSITRELEIATGGTIPILYYSVKTNEIKKISTPSEPIGVEKNTEYKTALLKTSPGDILVTCTDGLLESLNARGIQYSLESLTNVVKTNHQLSARDISNKVKTDFLKFCGDTAQHDDQSLLVIKIQ